jgi:Sortilin, neurotensin receptor 3,
MGSIYISDSTGTRFSLSLDHNVRTEEGQCDFEKILGLEGIYLANVYHKE